MFSLICSCITKQTTPKDANLPMKFGISSRFDWQLRNEIAKLVANFRSFKRTLETVCQKFCEMHCNLSAG